MAPDSPEGAPAGVTPKAQPKFLIFATTVIAVALLWVLLFHLNHWALSAFSVTPFISWIFFPAALRMLAVMVCQWVGALGLFVGALITNQTAPSGEFADGLILALLSAIGPLVAVWFCTRLLSLPLTLAGLTARQLLVFAGVGALLNAVPHNIYFYVSGRTSHPFEGLAPMFFGDLLGTLVVLYVASFVLRLAFKRSPV